MQLFYAFGALPIRAKIYININLSPTKLILCFVTTSAEALFFLLLESFTEQFPKYLANCVAIANIVNS